ncbi:hypothetical protein [Amycolatopsis sp. lyj-346]|uniref:hypothetical protein n=1 Tax=Amycolatopsis sp. lyj-346 TaxID=2789289 RepID=UPI00397D03E4
MRSGSAIGGKRGAVGGLGVAQPAGPSLTPGARAALTAAFPAGRESGEGPN